MTGTPSKDRAEAHAGKAKDVFRDYLKRIAYDRRACFEHDELLQELVAEALATSFAEGMKRAAEIAQEKAAEYDGYVKRAAVRDLPNGVDAEKSDVARAIRCVILSELERR